MVDEANDSTVLPTKAVVPTIFFFAGRVHNISNSEGLAILSASIYPGAAPGVSVPVIEVIAHGLLMLSVLAAFFVISKRQRTLKQAVLDSWEPLPTADLAVKFYTVVAGAQLAVTLSALALMCLPVVHSGAYAACVYAAHGLVDNLPWVCCLHRGLRKQPRALARSIVLVAIVTGLRLASVIDQTPLTLLLFSFAPTNAAMCLNAASGGVYALLLALTYCKPCGGGGRSGARNSCLAGYSGSCRGPLVRPEGRVWLAFLALTYIGGSVGYLLFISPLAISPPTAMWIGDAALYMYSLGFGPALYLTFRRERAHWREQASGGLPGVAAAGGGAWHVGALGVDPCARGASSHSQHLLSHSVPSSTAAAQPGGKPVLQAPPGCLPSPGKDAHRNAAMLRAALRGVRIAQPEEIAVHELAGSGGFADVFRGTWLRSLPRDPATGQVASGELPVALKQLRCVPREERGLELFCREVALMQRLRHPNVIAMLGVSISPNGAVAMITEFMPRGSVFQLLHPACSDDRGGGKPPNRVLAMRMLADCACGMQYLHSRSPPIIHRDLKSQNLLVAADFAVKVADFGLSRECLQPGAMTRVGSVQWAAPEVLLGKSYSHKADLWSFGVVCWEVLTALIPFHGMAQTDVAVKVAMEGLRLPVPPNAPIRLLRLIARCWSEAPEQRPSFDEVVSEVAAVEMALLAEGEGEPHPPA